MSTTSVATSSTITSTSTKNANESSIVNGSTSKIHLPRELQGPIDILLIDNFDSFTYNLYQSLSLLSLPSSSTDKLSSKDASTSSHASATPINIVVIRNDAITTSDFPLLDIKYLIISPGPGHPKTDSGVSREAIKYFSGKVPVLGVCMGLECLVDAFGGDIAYAGEIKHGKLSPISHDNRSLFTSIPQNFLSTRYHSLSSSLTTLPACLAVTAITQESKVIMGIRHREYTVEAVQYHPESVLSEFGDALLANFLKIRGGRWSDEGNEWARVGVEDRESNSVTGRIPPFPIPIYPPEEKVASTSQNQDAKRSDSFIMERRLPTILEKIYKRRMEDVGIAKSTPGTTPSDIQALLELNLAPPMVPILDRLFNPLTPSSSSSPSSSDTSYKRSRHTPALMAEIKRASPSAGLISTSQPAPFLAIQYALAGASVISVLTEPHHFKGSLQDLIMVRRALERLPRRPAVLRKDFIIDEYMIDEARLWGADSILIIVAMLPEKRVKELYDYAKTKYGMEPLVEVNSSDEMRLAMSIGAKFVGVNNRNLHTFVVDPSTTERVKDVIKEFGKEKEVILASLSGMKGWEDVKPYTEVAEGDVSVKAILVGEAMMKANDKKAFVKSLLGLDLQDSASTPPDSIALDSQHLPLFPRDGYTPLIKICGIRTPSEARFCIEAGVDMIGINFVKSSKRWIGDIEKARDVAAAVKNAFKDVKVEADIDVNKMITPWFTHHAHRLAGSFHSSASQSKRRLLLVGVFQNQPLSYIQSAVKECGLDMVQLHGDISDNHIGEGKVVEEIEWARWIDVPVVRVFHAPSVVDNVGEIDVLKGLGDITRPGYHQFVLLDSVRTVTSSAVTGSTGLSGGSGKLVDLELARKVVERGEINESTVVESESREGPEAAAAVPSSVSITPGLPTPEPSSNSLASSSVPSASRVEPTVMESTSSYPLPIILAGGLTPLNVRHAITAVRPWAVDVSGGVELEDGGGKDEKKIKEFVAAVRGVSG